MLLSLVFSPFSYAITTSEINQLENDFQAVSTNLYTALAKNLRVCKSRTRSLKRLNIQINKLAKQNKTVIAICLIQNHFPLLKENIDNKDIFPIFKFILNNNNRIFANKLYSIAKSEGDKSLVSNFSFVYAQYYLKHKEWKKVLQYTNGIYNDLSFEDANFTHLINGIALQNTKRHRKAVKSYLLIPKKSKYYATARLNIATAYIRQDWWTDAHIKIKEILNSKVLNTADEMINRLHLVLGYSLLRKEFYRDSRESFRNVELKSAYFNKALLGIALTATNQEDFISALNAINVLKSKKNLDLSVDESHLLLPYIYEKLNQNMTASATYTDALNYYKNRIKNITAIMNNKSHLISSQDILNNKNQLNIENTIIDFTNYFPVSFLENHASIIKLSEYIENTNNTALQNSYRAIKNRYNSSLLAMIKTVLNKRISHIQSYMNQSRFGLARLFDNSNEVNN